MRAIILSLVVAALLQAPPPRDTPRFATGTAVLSGTVIVDEPGGQPVKRAVITVAIGGDPPRYQTTDDNGRFTVAGLPAGNVRLTASKPGFVLVYYGAKTPASTVGLPIALTEGKVTDISVRLPRGAAISGTVTDPNGDPLSAVSVRAQRVTVSASGQRVLTPTTGASTDDRGAYRIFGLAAGDYVVIAQPRFFGGGDVRPTTAAELDWADRQIRVGGGGATSGTPATAGPPAPAQAVAYASVFFPGTVNSAAAGVIPLAAGQERHGVDLRMQFVPTARIEGTLTGVDGQPARGVQVILIPESDVSTDAERLLVLMEVGMMSSTVATSAADGSFLLQGVEPGGYTVLARRTALMGRGGPGGPAAAETAWAMTDVRVDGRDITGLAMQLAPGQSVTGRFVLETKQAPTVPRVTVSLRAVSTRGVGVATAPPTGAQPTETFTAAGLIPATYRVTAVSPGWTLKSAMLGNRDVADVPFEIKAGEDVSGLVLTLTDSPAEVSGTLFDGANRPTSDLSIVLFAADRAMWFQGSRRVRPAVRPATDGRFTFTGLVAGEYHLAALGDVSPADLANPQFLEQVVPAAIKITVGHGEKKTQDLKIAGK